MKPIVPADTPHPGRPEDPGSSAAPATGLERDCLRQAIHDVRGPLNTCAVLADLIVALLDKDPELARSKAPLVVRELQSVARMLDHLVGSSDTLATQTTAMDLGATLGSVAQSFATPAGITIDAARDVAGPTVDACPTRLPRLLTSALERCAAALPNGGVIAAAVETRGDVARLVLTARGTGAAVVEGRPHLTAAPGWFPVLALARGMRGDARLVRADGALRVEIDLPHGSVAVSGQPT